MSVTKEKLEEIFKVYDEKRNGSIRTEDISTFVIPFSQTGQVGPYVPF